MELEGISRDDLFYQISLSFCADGKISQDESNLLKNIAKLMDLDGKQANEIANNAIKKYQSGSLKKELDLTPDEIYQATLLNFSSDGIIDADEDKTLQKLKNQIGASNQKFTPLKKGYYANKRIKLKPLVCQNCNAPVPLEEKEWISCPYCKKKVNIPRTYVDTVCARKAIKYKKTKLDEFIESFTPPNFLERLTYYIPEQLPLVFFPLYFVLCYVLFEAFPFYQIAIIAKAIYKINLIEIIPLNSFAYFMIKFVVYYLIMGIPFALIYAGKRKLAALEAIQYSIGANPPKIKGNVPVCNKCGGNLKIRQDSFSAICDYCETINIMHLRERQVGQTKAIYSSVSAELETAIYQYRNGGKVLLKYLASLNVLFLIFGFVLYFTQPQPDRGVNLPYIGTKSSKQKALVQRNGKRFPFNKLLLFNSKEISQFKNPTEHLYLFMKAGEVISCEWEPFQTEVDETKTKLTNAKPLFAKNNFNPMKPIYILNDTTEFNFYLTRHFNSSGHVQQKLLFSREATKGFSTKFRASITGCYTFTFKFPYLKRLDQKSRNFPLKKIKIKVTSPK